MVRVDHQSDIRQIAKSSAQHASMRAKIENLREATANDLHALANVLGYTP
jgi:hypothetical protein